jgi:hypothetical protein
MMRTEKLSPHEPLQRSSWTPLSPCLPLAPLKNSASYTRGDLYTLFYAEQAGVPLCLKSPTLAPVSSGYYAAKSYFRSTSQTFYGGETHGVNEPNQNSWLGSLFLQSEQEHLRNTGGAWNHNSTALILWDNLFAHNAAKRNYSGLSAPSIGAYSNALVMPFYSGRSLSDFSPSERRVLFLEMLPALWEALCAAEHGALSEECLLISDDLARFRILSPGVVLSTTSKSDEHSSEESKTSYFFKTCAKNYPLLPPFYRVNELSLPAGFLDTFLQRPFKPNPTRLESLIKLNLFMGVQPNQVNYQSERPQPADLLRWA